MKALTDFQKLNRSIQSTFESRIAGSQGLVYAMATQDIPTLFLHYLPEKLRTLTKDSHNLRFLETIGHLAVMKGGKPVSLLWDTKTAPGPFKEAIEAVTKHLSNKRIERVQYLQPELLGNDDGSYYFRLDASKVDSALEVDLNREEMLKTMFRSLTEIMETIDVDKPVDEVIHFLRECSIENLSTISYYLRYFYRLKETETKQSRSSKDETAFVINRNWHTVTEIVREDIQKDAPKRRVAFMENLKRIAEIIQAINELGFSVKQFHARQQSYELTESPLTVEKVIEALGGRQGLQRRYATLTDLPLLWNEDPTLVKAVKDNQKVYLNTQATPDHVSWDTFRKRLLKPESQISIQVTEAGASQFVALTTSKSDALTPYHWDSLEARNPFAWFGIPKSSIWHWGINSDPYQHIVALTYTPDLYQSTLDKTTSISGLILLLAKARPEFKLKLTYPASIMKVDYRVHHEGIGKLVWDDYLDTTIPNPACGLLIRPGSQSPETAPIIRLENASTVAYYLIDHWY